MSELDKKMRNTKKKKKEGRLKDGKMESLVDGRDASDRNIKSMIKMLEMVDKPASENAVK